MSEPNGRAAASRPEIVAGCPGTEGFGPRKAIFAACTDADCKADAQEKYGSCKSLCEMVAKGPGKSMNDQADEAESKCAANDFDACATIGGAYLLGKGGKTKDEKKGLELLLRACNGGAAFGCEIYGRALDEGKGLPADHAAALTYWKKTCDGGAGGGCRSLALDLTATDPTRIPLLETACSKDDALGCMGLGAAYLHGDQGAPKDLVKAKQFLQKSCDLGASSACGKAAEL